MKVSDEDISQFLEEKENKKKNLSRCSVVQDQFLRERKLNDPEELTPLQLDASLRQLIVSVPNMYMLHVKSLILFFF